MSIVWLESADCASAVGGATIKLAATVAQRVQERRLGMPRAYPLLSARVLAMPDPRRSIVLPGIWSSVAVGWSWRALHAPAEDGAAVWFATAFVVVAALHGWVYATYRRRAQAQEIK